MSKKRRPQAEPLTNTAFLALIQEFTATYGYAPDAVDVAARCHYQVLSTHNKLLSLERQGLLTRLPHTANDYGCSWQIKPTMPSTPS